MSFRMDSAMVVSLINLACSLQLLPDAMPSPPFTAMPLSPSLLPSPVRTLELLAAPRAEETTQVSGDPHFTNIKGESFMVWVLGEVELLRVPRDSTAAAASLRVTADVRDYGQAMAASRLVLLAERMNETDRLNGSACVQAPYITAMALNGRLLGDHEISIGMAKDNEMIVSLGSVGLNQTFEPMMIGEYGILERPTPDLITLRFGNAWIDISRERFFLNLAGHKFESLHCDIGGVLGLDDHGNVSSRPAYCGHPQLLQLIGSPELVPRSTAWTSLTD